MLSELEKKVVRELQEGLPLVSRPFEVLGRRVGLSEEELLQMISSFKERGIIRRFGAAVRHQDLGYVFNAMVVWRVPEERIVQTGELLASFKEVTHCYQRSTGPGWPYNLFTMIHGTDEQQCRRIAGKMADSAGIEEYFLLFSTAELKKSSMKYFTD